MKFYRGLLFALPLAALFWAALFFAIKVTQ